MPPLTKHESGYMNHAQSAQGSCLCGKVHVTVTHMDRHLHACHCNMCRKWVGGPLFAVDCGTAVTFSGKEDISVYPSSDWGERGFCKVCGTSLFWRTTGEQRLHNIPIGLFDDATQITFATQMFIEEKPGYYAFADQTAMLTGEALFAMYAAQMPA